MKRDDVGYAIQVMRSLADVAAALGISKQAASKAARARTWEDLTW